MDRYLVFGGTNYYPSGGMNDFKRSFASFEMALGYSRAIVDLDSTSWSHVYDLNEKKIVAENKSSKE